VLAQRNNYLASYDFPGDCKNPEFYGESLSFQKVNQLQKFTGNPSEYRLIFFQLCKDYFVPMVAKKTDTLRSLLVELTRLVNNHGYELKEEQIMQSTEFNGGSVDWNDQIEGYFLQAAELQAKKLSGRKSNENPADNKEPVFVDHDSSSRLSIMFAFSKSIISLGPSFKKQEITQQINLKLTLGQLLTSVIQDASGSEGLEG